MVTDAPLRQSGATGSLFNPIAIFQEVVLPTLFRRNHLSWIVASEAVKLVNP